MNYLIVDDHPMTRQAVIDCLSEPGDAFTEADSGESAVSLFQCDRHDWVIMDVRMPGMGGLAAAREITTRYPGTRVVILSQFEGRDCAEEACACGALTFVSKERMAELPEILTELDRSPALLNGSL